VISIDSSTRSFFLTARLGIVTGLVYFLGTLYWVANVMQMYGGITMWVAALIALLLASYLSLYVVLFVLLLRESIRWHGVGGIWLAPAFWVAMEWLRSTVGGGFPWVLLGSSQATVLPVAQLASVTGIYGLSLLVALVSTAAAALAVSQRSKDQRGAIAVAVLLVVVVGLGSWRISRGSLLESGAPLRVGLVQGNVDQNVKYDARFRDEILRRYIDLSRRVIGEGAELVIWPEASTPFYFEADAAMAAPIRRLATEARTPFLMGTDEFAPGGNGSPDRYYNSAVLIGPDGLTRGNYRKMHLVPFGEYVPLKRMLFFVGPLIEAVSDFSAGAEPVVFDADGRRVSVSICYESVYPSISRSFVLRGSALLATITNDAWFGDSSAAYQHFEQGALRAIEEGRYVVRAANTGISGAVDPYGRVLVTTKLFEPAAVTVNVRLLTGRTIYSYTGDVVAWFALGATAGFVIYRLRSRSRRILRQP